MLYWHWPVVTFSYWPRSVGQDLVLLPYMSHGQPRCYLGHIWLGQCVTLGTSTGGSGNFYSGFPMIFQFPMRFLDDFSHFWSVLDKFLTTFCTHMHFETSRGYCGSHNPGLRLKESLSSKKCLDIYTLNLGFQRFFTWGTWLSLNLTRAYLPWIPKPLHRIQRFFIRQESWQGMGSSTRSLDSLPGIFESTSQAECTTRRFDQSLHLVLSTCALNKVFLPEVFTSGPIRLPARAGPRLCLWNLSQYWAMKSPLELLSRGCERSFPLL